jgi:hypothetical protein
MQIVMLISISLNTQHDAIFKTIPIRIYVLHYNIHFKSLCHVVFHQSNIFSMFPSTQLRCLTIKS